MGRLLLINGLPGSGKSTLAARYADDHPMSLRLDIDVVRGLVGGWLVDPAEAGRLARRMALAMVREMLDEGRDVVVPQFLGRPAFVGELEALAAGCGVPFDEVALLDEPDRAVARLLERAAGPLTPTQQDAHVLLECEGGMDVVPELHRRLLGVLAGRPRTVVVEPVLGDVEGTYRAMLDRLDAPAR